MSFAKEMVELQSKLTSIGHEVSIPSDTELHLKEPNTIDDLDKDLEHVIANNVLRACFDLLAASEAVIFLNLPKNGIEGYIGTSALMEMGLAYYLKKKIYLMYPFPSRHEHRWAQEVASIQPVVLNGDISTIK